MRSFSGSWFSEIERRIAQELLQRGEEVDVGQWHAMDVSGNPHLVSIELANVGIEWLQMPSDPAYLVEVVTPNLPWAEDHFQERVSGQPLNPPPSHEWWPFNQRGNRQHLEGEVFSHTYPERIWPKYAGDGKVKRGIRYPYGDLIDLIEMLSKTPLTRQAFLPIWFPEDTGAVHGGRVPCTLGYHFLIRKGRFGSLELQLTYYIRSCDFRRHFRDDVYLAVRLAQYVCNRLRDDGIQVGLGAFYMHVVSMHIFRGDVKAMERDYLP